MTTKEAIKFMLDEFYLEDQRYHAREMARGIKVDGDYWDGNSWDHPFMALFEEAIIALREELIRGG